MKKVGKDQTYLREVNNATVIEMILKKPRSGTEIAQELSVSSATASAIIKQLEQAGIIKVLHTTSVAGYGRRRVLYDLDDNFGLVLAVDISNFQATISLCSLHNQVLAEKVIALEKYDVFALDLVIAAAQQVVTEYEVKDIPLKSIVISVPGRVDKAGELVRSKQFSPDLFTEPHFIQKRFARQFGEIFIILVNDINLIAYGEIKQGMLCDTPNALFISVDWGIGGAFIIDRRLFIGDGGFAGEFGLIKYHDGKRSEVLDDYISLRYLAAEAEKIIGHPVSREELIALFHTNHQVKSLILNSATILGAALQEVFDVTDIAVIVLSGQIVKFGSEYLDAVRASLKTEPSSPEICFSSLKEQGKIIGAAYLGREHILRFAISSQRRKD
ncbi:MAG: ROK family protein [Bacilli bacterium]